MLKDIERVARESGLRLVSGEEVWRVEEDWPHIRRFAYRLATCEGEDEEPRILGEVDGYRIVQDWTVEDDLAIWDEADALEGDAVRYVEALIRELRVCEQTFELAPSLVSAQRVTILRHVEAAEGVDSVKLLQSAAASLAMMDAPVLMLIDPWPMADRRSAAAGKLLGRSHIPALLEIGFVRMVGSRFLWAWNRQLAEGLMEAYSYDRLLSAKREGRLDDILSTPLSKAVHGDLPRDVARTMDFPDPDDLMNE